MNAVTPAQRNLARWLLAQELGTVPEVALPDAAERACQKLGRRLTRLVTEVGYQALLARALHLARGEFPVLDEVRAGRLADVCLDGLPARAAVEPATLREALTAVLAAIIGLLVTFIGGDLTLRVVHDVWPEAPFGGMDLLGEEAQR
ncbi:MAG: hypothetical protein AB7R89_13470 [Dehalococcoidia bacterium]